MTRSYSRTTWLCGLVLTVFAALTVVAFWPAVVPAAAQPDAEIVVQVPTPSEVMVGRDITVTIVVTTSELYGYEFVVTFDPDVLEAVDAGFHADFLNPQYAPPGWRGTIDNVAGTVRFAATQQNPTLPVSGSGPVAWVQFRGKTLSPSTEVSLTGVKLGDSDGMPIGPVEVYPGYITVVSYAGLEVRVPQPGAIMEADGAITVTLVLTCVEAYGYQFILTFDPALLEAAGAGFDDSFLLPDYTPGGWSATVDNDAGTVHFAATQENPALPVTGSGTIGWVAFIGKSAPTLPATATVDIDAPRLANIDGMPMAVETISGTIQILPMSVITGQVELQGRTNWSGAVAAAWPGGYSGTSDASGFYTITLPTATYTITVEMARYLDAQRVMALVRGENPLPKVRLLGGDANEDDLVNIQDMSIIGGKYNFTVDPSAERADINADGVVNILDISIAGGNYLRVSPVAWP